MIRGPPCKKNYGINVGATAEALVLAKITPLKTNMEPRNDDVQQKTTNYSSKGAFFRFYMLGFVCFFGRSKLYQSKTCQDTVLHFRLKTPIYNFGQPPPPPISRNVYTYVDILPQVQKKHAEKSNDGEKMDHHPQKIEMNKKCDNQKFARLN